MLETFAALWENPTFSLFLSFCLFCLLAARKTRTLARDAITDYQQTLLSQKQDAARKIKRADQNLMLAKEKIKMSARNQNEIRALALEEMQHLQGQQKKDLHDLHRSLRRAFMHKAAAMKNEMRTDIRTYVLHEIQNHILKTLATTPRGLSPSFLKKLPEHMQKDSFEKDAGPETRPEPEISALHNAETPQHP